MTRRFKSDADVQKYFALQADLTCTPEPPADLWERIEVAQRAAKKTRAANCHQLSQPNLTSLQFPEINSVQKIHPIRLSEHLGLVPSVRIARRKMYLVKPVP
jgi:hypothetical protein